MTFGRSIICKNEHVFSFIKGYQRRFLGKIIVVDNYRKGFYRLEEMAFRLYIYNGPDQV